MRAIVNINGKQYEVEEGRYLQIDRYPAQENDEVTLSNVAMVLAGEESLIGAPFVDGATVKTVVKRHRRGPKVLVYKMRCKKGYRRKNGHRQDFTELQVLSVNFPGREKFGPIPEAQESTRPAPAVKKEAASAKTAVKASPKAATVETATPAETQATPAAEKPKKAESKPAEAPASAEKPKAPKKKTETASTGSKPKAPKSASAEAAKPKTPRTKKAAESSGDESASPQDSAD